MKRFRIRFAVGLAAMALVTLASLVIWLANPTVTVGAPAARLVPVDRIDHSGWDALLNKYVDSSGMVDYRAWQSSAADKQALD